ncbi:MAG: mechanosensitive ion channel family protein [Salinivirgaceae bacterium]
MEEIMQGAYWEKLLERLIDWSISDLPSIVFITVLFFVIARLSFFTIKRLRKVLIHRAERSDKVNTLEAEKRIRTLTGIIRGLIKIIIWVVYLMIILKKFGVDIGPILASAGILGLAIGFGAQELVRDFISGFFILLENQIRNGDIAIIDGVEGVVEHIELRTITLRDFSGVVHIFQNGKISSLANMTKEWSAINLRIGVAYKENVDVVMDLMKKVGDELQADQEWGQYMIEPVDVMGLDEFADSALLIKVRLKTVPAFQWRLGREYRRRLKMVFDEKGIEIPFPHTTLYWGDEIKPLQLNLESTELQKAINQNKS